MSFRDTFPLISYYFGKKLQVLNTVFYRKKPVKWTLKRYKQKFGVSLNLKDPKAFYEKMNYWKHFSYSKDQDILTDKILVKNFLDKLGYGDMCAKCYYSSDNIKDIKKWVNDNKDTYKRFVLKTSHSCGDVFIYDNGTITKKGGRAISNLRKVYKMLKIGLKFNHYYSRFEQNYKNLSPKVFIEEFIDFDQSSIEYEIMTNYGVPKFSNIVFDRQGENPREAIFDSDFKFLANNIGEVDVESANKVSKPRDYDRILKLVHTVCEKFPFCRVDFVQTNEKTYFCEFTFSKSGGMNIYKPKELNNKLGDLFNL